MAVRSRLSFAFAAAVGACAALPGCIDSDPLVRVEAGMFTPKFTGDIGLSSSTNTDVQTVDIASDLKLGDTDYVPYARGEVDFGSLNLALSGFKTSQSGTGTVTADFGNILAGSTVKTDLDLTLAQGRLVWDLLDTSVAKLGLGLAGEWVDFKLDQTEQTFGLTESIDVSQIVPLLAAHGTAAIPLPVMPMRFDVNAAGMSLHYGGIDGTVFDLETLLRGDFDHWGWWAGYRYVLVQLNGDIDNQSVDGNIKLSGWLLGLSVRF